jgi:CubicO group peptidase (beta-lactamase class C family)
MQPLEDALDPEADRTAFSGVVRVDASGTIEFAKAYGLADRRQGIPNTIDTQFGIASGTKGLTALAVVSLIEDGSLELGTTARSVLGENLPLIGDDVTVEQLLSHRSGIGDYFDEDGIEQVTDYALPVPVHELATTEAFLAVLDGHPEAFPPGERFAYNNWRFRRARVDRRAGERCTVPRAGAPTRVRTGRQGRYRVPSVR